MVQMALFCPHYCHLPSPVVENCCNPNCPTAKWSLFPYGIAFHSGFRLHRARGSPNLAPSGGTVKQLVVTGTSAFVAMLTLQDTHRSWIIYLYMSVCVYYQVFFKLIFQTFPNLMFPCKQLLIAGFPTIYKQMHHMAIHVAWLFEVTITCFYSSLTSRLQNLSPSKKGPAWWQLISVLTRLKRIN